jgi:hypothetical protein
MSSVRRVSQDELRFLLGGGLKDQHSARSWRTSWHRLATRYFVPFSFENRELKLTSHRYAYVLIVAYTPVELILILGISKAS